MKRKFKLHSLFFDNRFVFVFSIILALGLWIWVSVNFSPSQERTLNGINLTIDLKDTIPGQNGLKIYEQSEKTIAVTVRAKKYILGKITGDDLNVAVKTADVSTPGYKNLNIKVTPKQGRTDFEVVSLSKDSVEAFFDTEKTDTFILDPQIVYSQPIPDDYYKDSEKLSVASVVIKGASSEVNNIESVIAKANVTSVLTQSATVPVTIEYKTKNGARPKYIALDSGNQPIEARVEIMKRKSVPVMVDFVNVPAQFTSNPLKVIFSSEFIDVAGADTAIDELQSYKLGTIDFSQITLANKAFTFPVALATGLKEITGLEEITATIDLSGYIEKEFTIPVQNMHVVNAPANVSTEIITQRLKVRVIGPKAALEPLKDADITATLDLAGKELLTGSQSFPVTVSVKDRQDCWAEGTDNKISIKITAA